MRPLNILVVDDNQGAANALARVLRKSGDKVDVRFDGLSAIEAILEETRDVVLTDLKMEPVDGLAVLAAARELDPAPEVIVFTAFGAIDVAVRAIRMGARDFLTKPVSVEQIMMRLDSLRPSPPFTIPTSTVDDDFIAIAPATMRMLDQLARVAEIPTPVWIEGEVGTGRSFVARWLHRRGTPHARLVAWDPLHDVQWPERGTVLLSNADDLSEDRQRTVVRALRSAPRGVRIITTSEPDAKRKVTTGELLPELYYALAVLVVQVPPLRHRSEDVVPLFEQELFEHATRYRRERPQVDEPLAAWLRRQSWPGNVRELSNLAERLVVLGREGLTLDQPVQDASFPKVPDLEAGFSLPDYLEQIEHAILAEALRKTGGDRNVAGRLLGIERNTLRYKLNKYGLLDK